MQEHLSIRILTWVLTYINNHTYRYKHHHSSGALQVISPGASICIALDGLSRLIASPVLAFDASAAGPTALIHGDLVDGAIIISPAPNDLEQLGFVLKVWRNRRCSTCTSFYHVSTTYFNTFPLSEQSAPSPAATCSRVGTLRSPSTQPCQSGTASTIASSLCSLWWQTVFDGKSPLKKKHINLGTKWVICTIANWANCNKLPEDQDVTGCKGWRSTLLTSFFGIDGPNSCEQKLCLRRLGRLRIYIYICICICIFIYVYMYIYIYIWVWGNNRAPCKWFRSSCLCVHAFEVHSCSSRPGFFAQWEDNALPNVLTSTLTLMCCVILHDALIALEDKKTNQQTISHHLCFPQTRRFQTSS